jgi:LDH2 family malate/lactate/ureidoglycolate dehydrogenase
MGAILPFAGHKGYALGTAVQALSVLAGGDAIPEHFGNFGFFFMLVRRDLFVSGEQYDQRIEELVEAIRSTPPKDGGDAVRVPGQGSAERRREALSRGTIEIPKEVHDALLELLEQDLQP